MRRTPILALLVVLAVLAFLAGCGASGGDDTAGHTATTTAASDDTNEDTKDGAPTTTAADDDSSAAPTTAALVDILPVADDIGTGYTKSDEDLTDEVEDSTGDSSSDEADPTEQAIIDACPGAKVLDELDTDGTNPDEVSREFETDDQATIEVALDPTPDAFTEDNLDTVVEALADCGTIKTTDETGSAIEMTLKADRNDDHGDYGLEMSMNATFELMGTPISIEFKGLIFSVDGVTVSVVATSGLDQTTFESVPGDYDLLPDLADTMAERVGSL